MVARSGDRVGTFRKSEVLRVKKGRPVDKVCASCGELGVEVNGVPEPAAPSAASIFPEGAEVTPQLPIDVLPWDAADAEVEGAP